MDETVLKIHNETLKKSGAAALEKTLNQTSNMNESVACYLGHLSRTAKALFVDASMASNISSEDMEQKIADIHETVDNNLNDFVQVAVETELELEETRLQNLAEDDEADVRRSSRKKYPRGFNLNRAVDDLKIREEETKREKKLIDAE